MKTDELIAQLSQSLRPAKPLSAAPVRLALWFAAATTFLIVALASVRASLPFFSDVTEAAFVLESLAAFFAGLMAAATALYLSIPGERVFLLPLGLVIALALWIVSVGVRWGGLHWFIYTPVLAEMNCGRDILVGGFLSSGILIGMIKRAAPVFPAASGLLSALASALLAIVALQFFCSVQSPWHLITCHAAPAIVVTMAGAAAGRWLLAW